MVDYRVNIRVNDKELRRVKADMENVEVGVKTSGKAKTGGNIFAGILGKLGIIAGILAVFKDLLEPILNIVKFIAFVILWPLFKPLMDLASKLVSFFGGGEEGEGTGLTGVPPVDAVKIGKEITEKIKEMDLKDAPKSFIEKVKSFGQKLKETWIENFEKEKEFLRNIKEWLGNAIVEVGNWIREKWQLFLSKIVEIKERFSEIWNNFLEKAKKVFEKIKKFFDDFKEKVKNLFKDYFQKPLEKLRDKLKTIWDKYIREPLERVKSKIMGWASRIASFFRRKKSKEEKGSKQFGGTISETGLYMLHAGERVVPASINNTNNPHINITINASSIDMANIDSIARELALRINNYVRW